MKRLIRVTFAVLVLTIAGQASALALSKKEKAMNKCATAQDLCIANECGILSNPNSKDKCITDCNTARKKCVKKADRLAPASIAPGTGATGEPLLSTD